MKRCPECRRDYYDDTLLYCLDDGNALLEGPASADEPATAILSEPPAVAAGLTQPTKMFDESATAILPGGAEAQPQGRLRNSPEKLRFWHRERASVAEKRNRSANRAAKPMAALIAVLLIFAGAFFGYRYFSPARQIESIAVMPFVNESGNADVEYLSDGMTETLINSLSQLPNLSVKARSSVFRYKGKEIDTKKIASELNVQAILTGRVIQRGDQLTLNLELIDAQTENTIWGDKYERKTADIVSLQSEIARDVSQKLKTKLSGADEAKLAKTYTKDVEAYQLYLKGRYHSTKYTEEGFNKGIEYFNQAIARDANYALAYDGLAYCYYSNWYISAQEGAKKGKAAAVKALEIDPTLAEAHASLGSIYAWFEYDWPAAEREFRQSIGLNPNHGLARAYYGIYLAAMGRFDEAIPEAKRAVELEPLSAEFNTLLGIVYFYAKRYDEAANQFNKTIEIEPEFWWAHTFLARTYEMSGKLPAAISQLEKAKLKQGATIEVLATLGNAYAIAGKRDEALRIIKEIELPEKDIQSDGYELAVVYAGLGDKDKAFEHLDKEFATGGWMLNFLKVDPYFETFRSDPRFASLLKRVNLAE